MRQSDAELQPADLRGEVRASSSGRVAFTLACRCYETGDATSKNSQVRISRHSGNARRGQRAHLLSRIRRERDINVNAPGENICFFWAATITKTVAQKSSKIQSLALSAPPPWVMSRDAPGDRAPPTPPRWHNSCCGIARQNYWRNITPGEASLLARHNSCAGITPVQA